MKSSIIMFLLTIFSVFNICNREPEFKTLYDCSFESVTDIDVWNGLYAEMIVKDDAAPGQGTKCLLIGGGCLQPAAYLHLDSTATDAKYRLSCWAKKGEGTGMVVLTNYLNNKNDNQIQIHVDSDDWTYYTVTSDIKFTESKILSLELIVGGIIFNSIYIDGLKVEIEK